MPLPQFKLTWESAELRDKCHKAFEAQGVNVTDGINRLLRTFIAVGEELHPLLLDQVRGQSKKDLARAILRRMGK